LRLRSSNCRRLTTRLAGRCEMLPDRNHRGRKCCRRVWGKESRPIDCQYAGDNGPERNPAGERRDPRRVAASVGAVIECGDYRGPKSRHGAIRRGSGRLCPNDFQPSSLSLPSRHAIALLSTWHRDATWMSRLRTVVRPSSNRGRCSPEAFPPPPHRIGNVQPTRTSRTRNSSAP
jgi:hypothetical protein